MTTLISWIAYDQRGPVSLYVASDSRYSWGNNASWDSGRKVYLSNKYPDILGFCGDVVFCSQVMSQIISYIDACDIFEQKMSSDERFEIVYKLVQRNFGDYPISFALDSFKILYATREDKRSFHAYQIHWVKNNPKGQNWTQEKLPIPTETGLIAHLGSGGKKYNNHYESEYRKSEISGLSRSYYSSLCSHILSGKDPSTGGPVQLAGLFNSGSAKAHGVINMEKRYLYGMEVDPHERINNIRWVNDLFENCDGNIVQRYAQAQIQPLPRNLNNPLGKSTNKMPLPR